VKKKEARKDLNKLYGRPPYNTWSNIVAHDGIFAAHLEKKYGMTIKELKEWSKW
tara:strand:+ start:616 stop:777 length:162 start_codon:yes stop_codon:yes gene_type:complete